MSYSGRWASGVVGRREFGDRETGAGRRCYCSGGGEPCADCQVRIAEAESRELWAEDDDRI